MGITRGRLSIDEHFTAVPNEWARDVRLSRRARGLLVEVMSHRIGWHVTIRSLMGSGTEGRDAIRSAIGELLEHGYVKRSQGRGSAGKFGEIEYELCDPPTVVGFPDVGSAAVGSADVGESDTKKNISSEDHPQEDQLTVFGDTEVEISGPTFDDFWAVWPRKESKKAAEAAWGRAVKRAAPQVIVDAARAYAASPYRPEKQFVPHGATWLNGDRWNDPAPEARGGSAPMPLERAHSNFEIGQRLAAEAERRGLSA